MDQLRQDSWGDGPRKCDTHKALDFLTPRFGTRGSEVQILSPRPFFIFRTLEDQVERLSVTRRCAVKSE